MSADRLAFLTGATGFIGGRLAERLVERGWRLRCLVRAGSDTAGLERLDAELVRAELTDAAALTAALDGVGLAYHLAGAYEIGVVDAARLERVNVEGTRAFLEAVERSAVPRAVYVSTTLALGATADEGDERSEHPGPPYALVYERTKTEAHRLARSAQERGLPLIIACPANVYGPGDLGPNGAFIRDLLAGRIPGFPLRPAWYSYVHVEDVAEGLARAGERGRLGATYVFSGEHLRLDAFAREVTQMAGRQPPRLRFPAPAMRLTGTLLDAVARATGLRFPIDRERVEVSIGRRWLHSHAAATRDLGWRPRSIEAGLPETVAWFAAESRRGRSGTRSAAKQA